MTNLKRCVIQFCLVNVCAISGTGQVTTSGQPTDAHQVATTQTSSAGQGTSAAQADTGVIGVSSETSALVLALVLTPGKPPTVCVDRLKSNAADDLRAAGGDERNHKLRRFLSLAADPLCSTYLIVNSRQYHAASQYARSKALGNALDQLQRKVETEIVKGVKTMSQQTGSGPGTGGSTNLTAKGVAAKFLSVASEYGALTESTSGQTTTVNGTLAGVPVALMKKGIAEECSTKLLQVPCFKHDAVDYLGRISYSVSYDTSQSGQTISGTAVGSLSGTTQEVKTSGSSHSINAVSGKWVIIQGASSSKDIQTALGNLAGKETAAQKASEAAAYLQGIELNNSQDRFSTFQMENAGRLAKDMSDDPTGEKAVADWATMGTSLVELLDPKLTADVEGENAANSDVIKNAVQLAIDYSAYLAMEEDAAIAVAKPAYLTFEYDENRPANQPANSVFRGIFQHKIGQQASITINGAISIYDSAPSSSIPGAGRLRDAQFAMEADEPFSLNTAFTGKVGMTLSEAFYFQDQTSPAILNVNPGSPVNGVSFTGLPANATQIFAQKGNIGVGQIKVSIGTGSNLKVPLSVTYSNRTELIVKPTWRAQIGVSYDLDSLFQGK
jgi:hypothetical protein